MGALVLHQPEPAVESLSASGLAAHMPKILNEKVQVSGFGKNQCCGPGIFIPDPNFLIPDPGSRAKKFRNNGSGSASKNLSIFNSNKCFQALRKIIWDVGSETFLLNIEQRRTTDPEKINRIRYTAFTLTEVIVTENCTVLLSQQCSGT